MSETTSRKQWWLVLRRTGYRTIQVKIPTNWVQNGSEIDRYVDPVLNSDDWEFVDDLTGLSNSDADLRVQFEFVAITQPFESTSVDTYDDD